MNVARNALKGEMETSRATLQQTSISNVYKSDSQMKWIINRVEIDKFKLKLKQNRIALNSI